MIIDEDAYLAHYGILRKSGRYPWGSGGNVEERSRSFLGWIKKMLGTGMTEPQIAQAVGMTTTELRATRAIARAEAKAADIAMAQRLKDKGCANAAIGERMGLNESSVRALLAPGAKDRSDILTTTANMLKNQVAEKGYIDVGLGVERHIGLNRSRFDTALSMLKSEGYEVINVQVDQATGRQKTLIKVLAPAGTSYLDVKTNIDTVKSVTDFSEDGGRSYLGLQPPLSVDSKRLAIRYAEDGGTDADGVVYVRPGVDDLSLGGKRYAQVRIAVDNTHYIKGMAVYKDDLPDGVDLMFNTNKENTGKKLDALKPMKDDPEDPFGSMISRQIIETDAKGKPKVTSAMNIVNEEGRWDEWSRNLPSQMLSKQDPRLAKEQLDRKYEQSLKEFEEIKSLTNPAVKRHLLAGPNGDGGVAASFDSASVHLKAAAMPRQATQVILPINSMKDTEIYAPNFRDGERVALVRFPHGGTFEIPELTVNNRSPEARKILGPAKDAVGINAKVAERLSGADFDGDTVLVIPNNSGKIKSTPTLEGLKNFDPRTTYREYPGMKVMTPRQKQMEMGKVSNLITDMTIKGAKPEEVARAVRHSMVVIDAEKHRLNYKQSYIDNGIGKLKEEYQGSANAGASTLISRTSSETRVNDRRFAGVDPRTGRVQYRYTDDGYNRKRPDGSVEWVPKQMSSTKGAETKDAHKLSSGSSMEKVYAEHSNRMKALANEARKEWAATKPTPYSPSAKATYAKEVAAINGKLNVALRNAPLERQAQVAANAVISAKRKSNPDLSGDELKKVKSRAINETRARVGANKIKVDITDREWEAIQAGAVSQNKLSKVLANADLDQVRTLATPRKNTVMSSAKQQRARAMLNSGKTMAEIADALGVNINTLKSDLAS